MDCPHDFESRASANSATPAYDICHSHATYPTIINVDSGIKKIARRGIEPLFLP